MNVRPPIETSNPTAVLSVSFNSDSSCFAAGLESGICSAPSSAGGVCVFRGSASADAHINQSFTQSRACSRHQEVMRHTQHRLRINPDIANDAQTSMLESASSR